MLGFVFLKQHLSFSLTNWHRVHTPVAAHPSVLNLFRSCVASLNRITSLSPNNLPVGLKSSVTLTSAASSLWLTFLSYTNVTIPYPTKSKHKRRQSCVPSSNSILIVTSMEPFTYASHTDSLICATRRASRSSWCTKAYSLYNVIFKKLPSV